MSNRKPEPHADLAPHALHTASRRAWRTAIQGQLCRLRRPAILLGTAMVAASLVGCGSGSHSNSSPSTPGTEPTVAQPATTSAGAVKPAGDTTIRLQNIAIHPAQLTIKAGSIVTWRWLDAHIDTDHNVTSLPGGLQFKPSGTRLTGVYSIRFQKPGKYFYECTIHPASMQGEIVVE